MRNKLFAGALALAMTCTTVFSGVAPATVKAASVSTIQTQAAENSDEYVYCYAGLTWGEYWKSEGVYQAGNTASSDELDSHNETDKGAFDVVTRATSNHGLHRGNFQCTAIVYDQDGTSYPLAYWKDQTTVVLTDGSEVGLSKGVITLSDGVTKNVDHYQVTGLKYVPVAVKAADFEDFSKQYSVVENGGMLAGGYSESQLQSYSATASVDANTNGLKTATKNADGSYSFSARKNDGTTSGLADSSLKTVDLNAIKGTGGVVDANGSYGEFLRVDFNQNATDDNVGYGDLGAHMQAVKWTYYGNDSTRTTALATYGTKFAADNWMHKSNGIQLGLTDSIRCQLPEGTDGTGYWSLTIYALGYADSTYNFEATSDNIVKPSVPGDATELKSLVSSAEKLNKEDYTEKSWSDFETELNEAKELLARESATQAEIDEAYSHLNAAMNALVKVAKPSNPTTEKKDNTTTASKPNTTTATKPATKPAKPALKKSNVKLSKPALKVGKTTKNKAKLTWKKIKKATGYEIQYTTKTFTNKKATKTIKISKAKITSAQLKKLKKKTKYKVRIRAVYKKAGYQTVTSKWSTVKIVKTK